MLAKGLALTRGATDEAILDCVTSANIACGFHAGDPGTMRRTVGLALDNGVAIGAHPACRIWSGFGRRDMAISPQEAYELVVYQVGACGFREGRGCRVATRETAWRAVQHGGAGPDLAVAVATAVRDVDPALVLFGLSGSELVRAGPAVGLATASEVFADRTYQTTGR